MTARGMFHVKRRVQGFPVAKVPRSFRMQGTPYAGGWVRKRKEHDGVVYDSMHEADRAAALDMLKRAGIIEGWIGQVRVPVVFPNGTRLTPRGYVRIDFFVWNAHKGWFEDAKGGRVSERWPLIKAALLGLHGITVAEV